jgi:hypothetical protein
MKAIYLLYKERYKEYEALISTTGKIYIYDVSTWTFNDPKKFSTHIVANSYMIYLIGFNEKNLMNKILLDICYREITNQSDIHMYNLSKEHPLIKYYNKALNGPNFPSDGPLFTQQE